MYLKIEHANRKRCAQQYNKAKKKSEEKKQVNVKLGLSLAGYIISERQ